METCVLNGFDDGMERETVRAVGRTFFLLGGRGRLCLGVSEASDVLWAGLCQPATGKGFGRDPHPQ